MDKKHSRKFNIIGLFHMTIANSAQPNWEDINLGETFFSYPLRYIRLFFDKKLEIVFKNFNILLTI